MSSDQIPVRASAEAHTIQKFLSANPKAEQKLFAERDRFDVIVYYDQNSQNIPMAGEAMRSIKAALYELERQKPLRRPPMMLTGGFDMWQTTVGERGVFRFPSVHVKGHTGYTDDASILSLSSLSLSSSPHPRYEYACIRKRFGLLKEIANLASPSTIVKYSI
ncbi:ubiquitin-specific protease doa4 [Apophysomyces sp. BC1034]|nr:ubiquitin-specific protease doa4 [Apophysomyces sp. BC1015]KAG0176485.1 ubiquitin-specific protease doa4 [Apophysomyces sp. BC1021]KAG0191567.1 ubiquitin-specific protease doa4 [Apophysomyces sp. BC1034]